MIIISTYFIYISVMNADYCQKNYFIIFCWRNSRDFEQFLR